VTDADAEQESVRKRARELRVARRHIGRLMLPHVEDAGRDDERARLLQKRPRVRRRGTAAEPQRRVSERLDLLRRVGAHLVAPLPDADRSELHPGQRCT